MTIKIISQRKIYNILFIKRKDFICMRKDITSWRYLILKKKEQKRII